MGAGASISLLLYMDISRLSLAGWPTTGNVAPPTGGIVGMGGAGWATGCWEGGMGGIGGIGAAGAVVAGAGGIGGAA